METFVIIEEGGAYIGEFARENAPNDYIARLIDASQDLGDPATMQDAEGCFVTATP